MNERWCMAVYARNPHTTNAKYEVHTKLPQPALLLLLILQHKKMKVEYQSS